MIATSKRRSATGQYEPQLGGYRAFIPKPLPAGSQLDIPPRLQAAISKADRALARLDGSIDNLPDPDLFVLSYIRRESVLSSQIEGTQASLSDVLKAEARILNPLGAADVGDVINHIEALRYALSEIPARPIGTNLICEMHAILMRGLRGGTKAPGEIRTTQNWIGADGTSLGDAVFVPPPPGIVRDCLRALELFINEDQHLPLLVKVGLAHAQFETIHPFLDGNGRIGRMLITLMLSESEALSKPVLYISHYFRRHRSRYTDRLQATRDEGDWLGWLEFFMTAVSEVSEDATQVSRSITRLREEDRQRIIDTMPRGAATALKLHESLFSSPLITVTTAAEKLSLTFAAANTLVARLVDLGILAKVTNASRGRAFLYENYYRLFEPAG